MTHDIVLKYKDRGYEEDHKFNGEYTLLIRRSDMSCVRVYEDGNVWINTNGNYERIER